MEPLNMEYEERATANLPKKRKSRSPSKSGDDRDVDHVNKPKRRQAIVPKSIAHCAAEQVGVEYNLMHSFSLSSCKNGKTTAETTLVGSGRTDEETKDGDEESNDVNKDEEDDNDVDQIASAVESGEDDSEDEEKR